jgi:hypothetical protein
MFVARSVIARGDAGDFPSEPLIYQVAAIVEPPERQVRRSFLALT